MVWARAEDTAAHLENFESKVTSTVLGRTGLSVSDVGFGSYRINENEPDHRDALRLALSSGINLIDTSSNYMDGGSERLIGDVMLEMMSSGRLRREQVVIVTKAGYVQGTNLRDAKRRMEERRPFPDMAESSPNCWHNISPEFLEDQISRSLARLQLECLDVFLLHNPENILKASTNRELLYERIQKAFTFLESEVERKRIRFYGISSNTFPDPDNRADFLSLDRVWQCASAIKKNHHFAVVQFPLNVFEGGSALNRNNDGQTLLEKARELKLGVLVNRPFNAIHRGRLIRLTSFPMHDDVEVKGRLHTLLGRLVEMERRFKDERVRHGLSWGQLIRDKLPDLGDVLQWRDVLNQQILPNFAINLERLGPQDQAWANEYRDSALEVFDLVTKTLESLAQEKAALLGQQLQGIAPTLATQESTLSQKAVRIYHSLKGVNSVLVGMRKPSYVEDMLKPAPTVPEQEAVAVLSQMIRTP